MRAMELRKETKTCVPPWRYLKFEEGGELQTPRKNLISCFNRRHQNLLCVRALCEPTALESLEIGICCFRVLSG